jgi:hypothetical protein
VKICYLILAHNNFRHLDRLINALNGVDCAFYIHLDKKTIQEYTPQHKNVEIIPERIDINWGGFSMIRATLALMEYGMAYSSDADYYILISGVDYPVRSKEFLYQQLEKRKEYIDIAPVPVLFKPLERYEYYYFDYDCRNLKHYHPKFLTEVLLKKLKIKRKAPFKVYAGTQWFALTRGCVQYILMTIGEDKRYIDFFRYTLVPDEAFFQTVIGNSPFLQNAAASLTYTDWEVAVPPATIEERHIDFLESHIEFNDEYGRRFPYFARKFNDGSEKLLEEIQIRLWG